MPVPTTLDVLEGARDLLDRPYAWTTRLFYRKRRWKGQSIDCYCLDGALRHAAGGELVAVTGYVAVPQDHHASTAYRSACTSITAALRAEGVDQDYVSWNDFVAKGRKDVVALLTKTINRLKEA